MKTRIVFIDEKGNAHLENKDFKGGIFNLGDSLTITVNEQTLEKVPFHSGLYCKMFGTVLVLKDNTVFLAIRNGSAKEKYNLYKGQNIYIDLKLHGYYWEKENAYSFTEISDRKFYESEESFANFRPLFQDSNHFYRSSSPVDDAYHRAKSVRSCVKKFGIKTIINMADTAKEYNDLVTLLDDDEIDVLRNCKIYPIGNESGLYSKEFEYSILTAMKLIIESETPCMIHCRAGKRRSGFVCAILQPLYGMSAEEIMSDYMISYENNNRITYDDNPKRYDYLKDDTIKKILHHINGANLNDLINSTIKYLEKLGLSHNEIKKLISKLR